ncbi:MAG: hypothetical protein WC211_08010 [Dehalococcoidia bacterium]
MPHALVSPARRSALLVLVALAALALLLGGCSKPKAKDTSTEQAAKQAEQSAQTKQAASKVAGTLKSDVKPLAVAVPLSLPKLDGLVVAMPSPPKAVAPVKVASGGTPSLSLNLGMSVQTPAANVSLGMPPDLGSILASAMQGAAPVPTSIPTPPAVIPTAPAGIPPVATPPAGFGPPTGIPPGATPPAGFGPPPGFTFP